MQGSFQLKIRVEDIDSGEDDLVDIVIVQLSALAVKSTFTTVNTYSGMYGNSISLQFRVTCAETYYGTDCTTKCVPTDNTDGHYSCNSDGTKACLPGWSGASTNCLTRELVHIPPFHPLPLPSCKGFINHAACHYLM